MNTTSTTYKTLIGDRYIIANHPDAHGYYHVTVDIRRNAGFHGPADDYFDLEDCGARYVDFLGYPRVHGSFSVKARNHSDALRFAQDVTRNSPLQTSIMDEILRVSSIPLDLI